MRPGDLVGHTVGHYRIIRSLGFGGSATIFLAEDINLQREVALKVFEPGDGDKQTFLRRFAREARVLAQLDHPNILPVYDYGEQDDIAYLVMPYMAGGSLKEFLQLHGAVPPSEAVKLIAQILNALQYAHNRRLIHRDIKPGNMLFKADGTLVLSDFGLVKVMPSEDQMLPVYDSASASQHLIMGTPDYIAPEQITGKVEPASDIYSIGVVLYEMLTGATPFTAENQMGIFVKHLYEQPRPLRAINPQISPELEAVILRTLAKDAAKRYQRPDDLLQALIQAVPSNYMTQAAPGSFTPGLTPIPPAPSTSFADKTIESDERIAFAPVQQAVSFTLPSHTRPTTPPIDQGPYHPISRSPVKPRGSSTPIITALILVTLVLIVSLSAFLYTRGVFGPPANATPTPSAVARSSVTTQPIPQTTTDCPATGTARAAIITPLVLGNHQNVVYIVNEGTFDNPTFGTLKRRDISANKGIEITKMAGVYISEAQISQDQQWVLFTARVQEQYQLRMVRMDGQGLQTLYCAPTNGAINATQWSFDRTLAVFNVDTGGAPITYLLEVATGKLQPELVPQSSTLGYVPRTWLDAKRVYMIGITPHSDAPTQNIYILDTGNGANQHDDKLTKVYSGALGCTDFDSSFDTKHLYLSTCSGSSMAPSGPSTVTIQPASGGTQQTIYNDTTAAVTTVRSVTSNILLLMVHNATTGDTSKNGLWSINTDGTGLTRLTTDTNATQALCPFTQFAWSNLSRDNHMYALQAYDPTTKAYMLYYGSLSGGTPQQFANISDGTELFLVGWTTV